MFEISDDILFAAAHRLRFTEGEGEALHGHNWRVRAFVRSATLDRRGMVKDFADLHAALLAVAAPLENRLLNELTPFDDVNPTAENLARFFAEGLTRLLTDGRVWVQRVEVWETESCCATYLVHRSS